MKTHKNPKNDPKFIRYVSLLLFVMMVIIRCFLFKRILLINIICMLIEIVSLIAFSHTYTYSFKLIALIIVFYFTYFIEDIFNSNNIVINNIFTIIYIALGLYFGLLIKGNTEKREHRDG